jgi:hypothetical protein
VHGRNGRWFKTFKMFKSFNPIRRSYRGGAERAEFLRVAAADLKLALDRKTRCQLLCFQKRLIK